MEFINLKKQYEILKSEINKNIQTVLNHGRYIMGPEIQELEEKLKDYTGTRECIACSSGTDALLMPLMAIDAGPGDAVFTTPFTFIATAEVISYLRAKPVFADIEYGSYNLNPDRLEEEIEKVIKQGELKPKAVIAVDIFGLPADYDRITEITDKYGLYLIEDAAQSFGGAVGNRKACSFGDIAATSFFPAKPLGCYGDGGAVFTDDNEMAEKIRSIRIHGQGENRYENVRIGINGRIDSIQAATLLAKLTIFNEELRLRNEVAGRYIDRLKDKVTAPIIPPGYYSAWAQFSVLTEDSKHRAALQKKLSDNDVPTAIYYPKPLHLQTTFQELKYKTGDFPVSEDVSSRIFSLPMHPYLTEEEIEMICSLF